MVNGVYDISNRVVNELMELSKSKVFLPDDIIGNPSFLEIWKLLDTDEYIGYSPISQFAFSTSEISEFKSALTKSVINTPTSELHTDRARIHFFKILDHIELVGIQSNSIDERQQVKIDQQNAELTKLSSDITKSQDLLTSLTKELANTETKTEKLTVDFVTILGIFTSITFATFGGLQLLGNVFGKIKDVDSVSVGSELMLGAVFLFGTYMILVSLLTGISKLMGKDYKTSYPTRFLVVFSFFIIFVFGLIYANVNYMESIFTEHAFGWSIGLIIVTVIIGIVAICIDKWHQKRHS